MVLVLTVVLIPMMKNPILHDRLVINHRNRIFLPVDLRSAMAKRIKTKLELIFEFENHFLHTKNTKMVKHKNEVWNSFISIQCLHLSSAWIQYCYSAFRCTNILYMIFNVIRWPRSRRFAFRMISNFNCFPKMATTKTFTGFTKKNMQV